MTSRTARRWAIAVAGLWAVCSVVTKLPAEDDAAATTRPPGVGNDPQATQVADLAKQFTGRCEFTLESEPQRRLTLHPHPILRFSNPTVGQVFGDTYLWTDRGRPAVVASYYKFFSPDWGRNLEVSSLAEGRISARMDQVRFWTPAESGVTFQPLADAEPPAPSPAARLVQMRRLAAGFKALLADTRNEGNVVTRQLRQLTQPVYRYPPADADATYLDGAMFAFVEGTDPEVLLLLEAVPVGNVARWRFGLARTNGGALRVTFRDRPIWSVPHLDSSLDRVQEPYTLFSLEHPLKESRPSPANGE
ncbi:MAG TPA: hypothetical protein VM165_07215 [Planctomycetaceae bacterium]|nr:hypothetical protein [Planctomycetaceae bacterium]